MSSGAGAAASAPPAPAPPLSSVPFPPPTYVAGWHDEASVRRMRYVRLGAGADAPVVSALSYGASALGGVFGAAGGADEARALIHAAVRGGINLLDVAPWYGHGTAERALGDALQVRAQPRRRGARAARARRAAPRVRVRSKKVNASKS